MPISYQVDEDHLRLTLTFSGVVRPQQFDENVMALYRRRPELFAYDCVTDLRSYEGDLTNDDLRPLVELYSNLMPASSAPSRSYLVTDDPSFALWGEALDLLFPGRVHEVVHSLTEAHARLDQGGVL